MRSLKESIMDVDTNIDELEIPEKPKVSKSDYPYYEQAWYDILNNMLDSKCSSRDYAIYIKIYKEWLSEWSCYIDYDFNIHDFDKNEWNIIRWHCYIRTIIKSSL